MKWNATLIPSTQMCNNTFQVLENIDWDVNTDLSEENLGLCQST